MKRGLAICMALGGCAAMPAPPRVPDRPMRIVSLDYCADQYVLKLVERDRVLAVSPDAARPFSYMRAAAARVRRVRPSAEDVLVLKPDLVVRSYGGGANAEAFFAAAGVPVLQLGYVETIAQVRDAVPSVAAGLGAQAKGAALLAQVDARLAALPAIPAGPSALYATPGGVTTGPGGLVDEMLRRAGYRNFQREAGWHPLPLERLAYARPDLLVAASFASHPPDRWSAVRHPVAVALAQARPTVPIDGAWTACGGWFVLDAVEALARARPR